MIQAELPLRRIDHVRFFVGNARQSAYFYRNAFGFDVIAYEGLETGVKHEAGYVLRQGQITFVLTSSLREVYPARSIDGVVVKQRGVAEQLRKAYRARVLSASKG